MEKMTAMNPTASDINNFYSDLTSAAGGTLRARDGMTAGVIPRGAAVSEADVCIYRIKKISYDEDFPRREAFENVLASFSDGAFNIVYILSGSPSGVELCIGVIRSAQSSLHASEAGDKLSAMIKGNFGGSELEKLRGSALSRVMNPSEDYRSAGFVMGIPSEDSEKAGRGREDFQGIDRLINSMIGETWRIVIICEPVRDAEIDELLERTYSVYNIMSEFARETRQTGTSSGQSDQTGKSSSKTDTEGKSAGFSRTDGTNSGTSRSSGSNSGDSDSTSSGSSTSKAVNEGTSSSRGVTDGTSSSTSKSFGSSSSLTRERADKHAQEIMSYIDEELLKRLKYGRAKGMFRVSVRYMADSMSAAERLRSSMITLFQGDASTFSPLRGAAADQRIRKDILDLRPLTVPSEKVSPDVALLYGRPLDGDTPALSTYMTSRELSLFAGLPQREVPGINLVRGVEFGLNIRGKVKDPIELGSMIQRGRRLNGNRFSLSRSSVSSHIFIGGVTGSGKTTTCQLLLRGSNMPFLVIEPAKTEYRRLINDPDDFKDMIVFTPGNETCAPFRLNPFELMEGESISSHIDMVRAAFTASFRMEASMPQLLEEAIVACYEEKDWDIVRNNHKKYGRSAYSRSDVFPNLSDLIVMLEKVTKKKNFGDRLQSEYIGSLVSRISNLTVGVKGEMLNCRRSIDFRKLVRGRAVIEMEEMRSPDDKALLMGFILAFVSATVRLEYKRDKDFRHITLIEEAHRLLANVEAFEASSRKSAVEMFADLLAEVRKYGEGFVVVDQIPQKLAPDVLKNTNTKIIHRLFAKDDKDAVGAAMMMDEKQRDYLSALAAGEAVVLSDITDKPMLIQVDDISYGLSDADDEQVHERFTKVKDNFGGCFSRYAVNIAALIDDYMSFMHKLGVESVKCVKEKTYVPDETLSAEAADILRRLADAEAMRDEELDGPAPGADALMNLAAEGERRSSHTGDSAEVSAENAAEIAGLLRSGVISREGLCGLRNVMRAY